MNSLQVEKLGQFAREVTRVSIEVGTEGLVFYTISYLYGLLIGWQ